MELATVGVDWGVGFVNSCARRGIRGKNELVGWRGANLRNEAKLDMGSGGFATRGAKSRVSSVSDSHG